MWHLVIERSAERSLRKIDRTAGRRIKAFLLELCAQEDPAARGKALTGEWAGYWRYRVGDYRVICSIERGRLRLVVVELGLRSSIYG